MFFTAFLRTKTVYDKMVGWHHRLTGQEFEQTPGDSEGQGSLACCMQSMRSHRVGHDLVPEQQLTEELFKY